MEDMFHIEYSGRLRIKRLWVRILSVGPDHLGTRLIGGGQSVCRETDAVRQYRACDHADANFLESLNAQFVEQLAKIDNFLR